MGYPKRHSSGLLLILCSRQHVTLSTAARARVWTSVEDVDTTGRHVTSTSIYLCRFDAFNSVRVNVVVRLPNRVQCESLHSATHRPHTQAMSCHRVTGQSAIHAASLTVTDPTPFLVLSSFFLFQFFPPFYCH